VRNDDLGFGVSKLVRELYVTFRMSVHVKHIGALYTYPSPAQMAKQQ
jgi:hypothetical protein